MSKSYNLKLNTIFAAYLYQHKILNLPGIGTFTLDASVTVPENADRNSDLTKYIQFEQKPVAAPDAGFIDFIRVETGKIRPLAESDLESFLSDGKILLNIGKPFHFEGIGSLIKNRAGAYEFQPGEMISHRQDKSSREHPYTLVERSTEAQELFPEKRPGGFNAWAIVAALLGIGVVIFGGYFLYQYQTRDKTAPVLTEKPAEVPAAIEEPARVTEISTRPDSSLNNSVVTPRENSAGYRFIIETTANPTRALKRYGQLKSYFLDIRMDALQDSSLFKLYFVIPASPADTSRIKDSLQRMYSTRGVSIE